MQLQNTYIGPVSTLIDLPSAQSVLALIPVIPTKGAFQPDTRECHLTPWDSQHQLQEHVMDPETEPFYTRVVATLVIFVVSLLGEAQIQ